MEQRSVILLTNCYKHELILICFVWITDIFFSISVICCCLLVYLFVSHSLSKNRIVLYTNCLTCYTRNSRMLLYLAGNNGWLDGWLPFNKNYQHKFLFSYYFIIYTIDTIFNMWNTQIFACPPRWERTGSVFFRYFIIEYLYVSTTCRQFYFRGNLGYGSCHFWGRIVSMIQLLCHQLPFSNVK